MSITLKECFGRQYTNDINGKQSGIRMYLAVSTVAITDLDDVITDALTAGLPALGAAFSGSAPNLIVIKHIPQEVNRELGVYQIQVQYDAKDVFKYGFITTQPWQVEFYAIPVEKVATYTTFDTTGYVVDPVKPIIAAQPILDTAGFPFTEPPVIDRRNLLGIRLSKNFTSIASIGTVGNINTLMSYVNTVHFDTDSANLTIAGISGDKYTFYMDSITARNSQSNGIDYYAVTFDVIYDPEYHIEKIINAGKNEIKNAKAIAIVDENGAEISNNWTLDINGAKLTGLPAARAAATIYLGFGIKEPKDFGVLGLPTTF